jgi:mono/diheme cytochrome c family protein
MNRLVSRFGVWIIGGLLLLADMARAQPTVLNPLPAAEQTTFFHLPEGGAVMPLAWYRGLDVIDARTGQRTGQTFAERMDVYGFLADDNHELPVGFGVVSLDFLGGLPGLSLNCAACHVGELHHQGQRVRIIGGPNLADARRFSQDVYASSLAAFGTTGRLVQFLVRSERLEPATVAWLETLDLDGIDDAGCQSAEFTADDPGATLTALVQRARRDAAASPTVRKSPDSAVRDAGVSPTATVVDLYRNLQLVFAELGYFTAQGRFPLSTREGPGRLDAFATVRFLLHPNESTDFPFTAPVSVPPLWGVRDKKWLHWNANTNSALQRNISQALGMGALEARGGVTNVLFPNLHTLETVAETIAPPAWPEAVFGPLDANLVAQGRTLYQARCAHCHDSGTVDPTSGLIEYRLFSLAEAGTDPNYALNFHQPVGATPFPQVLQQRMKTIQEWYYDRRDPRQPVPIPVRIAWGGGPARLPAVWRDPLADDVNAPVYPALPLTGVWATAPYLHNNSVPTLRQLLMPAVERPTVFMVGHREYDPVDVGYTQSLSANAIPDELRFDTREAGNANSGHDGPAFGADDLSDADLDALLEYLKSL